jgi:hypothetical protein
MAETHGNLSPEQRAENDAASNGHDPRDAPSGSVLADLVRLREGLDANKREEFALPGFDGRLWATCRLPKTGRHWALTKRLADDDTPDQRLVNESADFIYACTVGLFMRTRDGGRQDFPGLTDEEPAGYADLPESLTPPRPAGKGHTGASRVIALFNQNGIQVLNHAAEIAGWAAGGRRETADEFAGKSEGDRS